MWVYSDKVKDHFTNPKNILDDEKAFNADGKGDVGNAVCGDMMIMVIKVDDEKQIITDCKWKTYGCASAIASTSVLSEMAVGMTLAEAYGIKPKHILKQLDGLPNHKVHCSVLGDRALRSAIDDYLERNKLPNTFKESNSEIICKCLNISRNEIKIAVVEKGAKTFEELQGFTKIGTSCGGCIEDARAVLEEFIQEQEEIEEKMKK